MKIQDIKDKGRKQALVYLENNINAGSPSGFSNQKEALGQYSAGRMEPFDLWAIKTSYPMMEYSGNNGFVQTNIPRDTMLIHPLVFEHLLDKERIENYEIVGKFNAYVTASGRTVLAEFPQGLSFVKLHFPGILGRVERHLPLTKAIAGVEVSHAVEQLILSGKIKGLGLLSEMKCCGIVRNGLDDSIAYVERSIFPINEKGFDKISFLIPGFSLFSKDIKNLNEPTLLQQICEDFDIVNELKFYNIFLRPLIDGYLKLTFEYGLMPEINAQNVLYAINFEKNTIYPVLRDMGRVEKLLYINSNLSSFISCPYKTIKENQQEYAIKRHSFSFDFKLTQYVIEPIINIFCNVMDKKNCKGYKERLLNLASQSIDSVEGARIWLSKDRKMIGHPKMLLTKDRPYIEVGVPSIR